MEHKFKNLKKTETLPGVPEAFRDRIILYMGLCQAHRNQKENYDKIQADTLKGLKDLEADQENRSELHDRILYFQGAVKAQKLQRAAFDKVHNEAEKELTRLEAKLHKYQRANPAA